MQIMPTLEDGMWTVGPWADFKFQDRDHYIILHKLCLAKDSVKCTQRPPDLLRGQIF